MTVGSDEPSAALSGRGCRLKPAFQAGWAVEEGGGLLFRGPPGPRVPAGRAAFQAVWAVPEGGVPGGFFLLIFATLLAGRAVSSVGRALAF